MRAGNPVTGGIGLVVVLIIAALTGVNPLQLLGGGDEPGVESAPPGDDPMRDFVSAVLGSTEETWSALFSASGQSYREPSLVLFSGLTSSGCGTGQSAMGPFYCLVDQTVYIDLSFYEDLRTRFQAPGDFAQAYVIAHEVGHHIQNVTGALSHGGGNEASVRQELQADCLAGVWGYYAREKYQLLHPGDMEEALNAAAAIGDDRLQKQTQGHVVPESFTHGSSAQRVAAFRTGFESGDLRECGM